MMEQEFKIRPYFRRELAMMYFPHLRPKLALDQLRRWIERCTPLKEALKEAGYRPYDHIFTPRQVKLVVEFLGEP